MEYLRSPKGIEALHAGELKLVAWTNNTVKRLNQICREILYPEAKDSPYVPGDIIILTSPLTYMPDLELMSETNIRKVETEEALYSNTKLVVDKVFKVVVKLNKTLHIPCYKLHTWNEDGEAILFSPIDVADFERISHYYEVQAWALHGEDKRKKYKERHLILSCFANILHFYAGTSYRLQGATVEEVMVFGYDIGTCNNIYEAARHRYVAASRARGKLMYFRGFI
jgi:hypothetical protein